MYKYLICLCLIGFIDAKEERINQWQKTTYIWNYGLIQRCDKGLQKHPIEHFDEGPSFNKYDYNNIKKGDIVWVKCLFIPNFCKEVLPKVKNPFVLVISDGDESFPSDFKDDQYIEQLLNNKNVIHIFAQNLNYKWSHFKLSHLPIGLDFHTIAYSKFGGWGERGTPVAQEALLTETLSTFQPTYLRKIRAFVDFQLSDTTHAGYNRYLEYGEDRASIFKRLLETGLIDYSGFMPRKELWKTKGNYAFSISPHGNGLDCHRTWEDLVLGCIVIVKTSALDPLYEGLPVVIVNDWSEITYENMQHWLAQYHDAFTNPDFREKLTNQYWWNKIKAYSTPFK